MDELSSWNDWLQDVGKQYIQTRTEAQYKAPVEIQKMKLQAYGPYGEPYTEGETTANKPLAAAAIGIPTSWLFIGGAIALVMMLKD